MNKPSKYNTSAVIVSFNPEEGFLTNIKAINKQVDEVIIIDNGTYQTEGFIDRAGEVDSTVVKCNDRNRGLATALNQGVREAISRGSEWVVTLDQDTTVMENLMEVYQNIFEDFPESESIGLMGANFYNKTNDAVKYHCRQNTLWQRVDFLITSGTLMPTDVWEEVGPFRDEFFIDRIDTEYCLRCRQHGLEIVSSCEVLLHHNAGNKSEIKLLGLNIPRSTHSDKRRYYIVRNQLILSQEYFLDEPRWTTEKLLFILLSFLYKKSPQSTWHSWVKYNTRGIYDGILKNTGEIAE